MNSKTTTALALSALIAGAGVALAQQGDRDKQGGPQGRPTAQQAPAAKPAAQGAPQGEMRGTSPQTQRGDDRSRGEAQAGKGGGASEQRAEPRARDGEKRTEQSRQSKDRADREPKRQNAQSDRDGRKDGDGTRKGAEGPQGKSKSSAERSGANRDTRKAAEGELRPDGKRAADNVRQPDQQRATQLQVPQQERTRVVKAFRDQKVKRVDRVNFQINIGTRIPRSYTLHPVPAAVLSIAPAYRGYRYIMVEDRICIVDPATYEIVYVLDERGSSVAGGGGSLTLSSEERDTVLRFVERRSVRPTFEKFRMAVGADVPRDVRLVEFPDEITADIPRLRGYRFVVTERNVVIVDDDDREVALTIER